MTTSPSPDAPVLIVDDDAASARLVVAILRAEGISSRIASSAEEATEMIASRRPRIIVLDLILPLMSGLLFAQQLKGDPATRDIVLIATTIHNGAEAERAVRAAGIDDYLRKPIDPAALIERVLSHMKGVER